MLKLEDKYKIIFKIENTRIGVNWVEGSFLSRYGDLDFVFTYENFDLEAFLPESEVRKAAEIGYDFCLHREKTKKLHKEINNHIKKVRTYWAYLDDLDFSKLDSKHFKKVYVDYLNILDKLHSYFSFGEFYYYSKVEDEIKAALLNQDDYTILLTSPQLNNFITKEKYERRYLKNKSDIKKHLKKYDFIPYADGKKRWTEESFIKELKETKQTITGDLESEDEKLLRKQKEILRRLKLPEETLNLIDSVKEWQEIKWMMRIFINRTFVDISSFVAVFLREMSKRTKLPMHILGSLYYNENMDVLDGKKIDIKGIKNRTSLYFGFTKSNKYGFLYSDEAKQLIKEVKSRTEGYYEKVTILKGRVASPGKVTGKARVFRGSGGSRTFKTEITKMKQGEILVAESTSPEFMSAMLKAAAIVADEGGITSHAAIVSRELKIPCVVGTHYALNNIKTGDLIEVDAVNGIVRIINE